MAVLNLLVDFIKNANLKDGKSIINGTKDMINALKDDPEGKYATGCLARKHSFDLGLATEVW